MLRSLAKRPLAAMEQMLRERTTAFMETKPMTSDAAVNAEEREIARTMDDEKQRDDIAMERPKEQRIKQLINDAERKREQQDPPTAPPVAPPQ